MAMFYMLKLENSVVNDFLNIINIITCTGWSSLFLYIYDQFIITVVLVVLKYFEHNIFPKLQRNGKIKNFPTLTLKNIYFCIFVSNFKGEQSFTTLKVVLKGS